MTAVVGAIKGKTHKPKPVNCETSQFWNPNPNDTNPNPNPNPFEASVVSNPFHSFLAKTKMHILLAYENPCYIMVESHTHT